MKQTRNKTQAKQNKPFHFAGIARAGIARTVGMSAHAAGGLIGRKFGPKKEILKYIAAAKQLRSILNFPAQ